MTIFGYGLWTFMYWATFLSIPFLASALMEAKGRSLYWCIATFVLAIPLPVPMLIYACFVPKVDRPPQP